MSTFIINLNDTVALSDSTLIELAKVVNSCQPCIQGAETNFNSIWITMIICLTAVAIVGIVTLSIYFQNIRKVQKNEDVEKCKKAINCIAELEQRVKELEDKFGIPSDEKKVESFIEFCQNRKSFEDKMAEKCIAIYESLMKKRLNVN